MRELYPINIWINEERYEKLKKAGLADMTKDVLAGMKVLQLKCTTEERDEILKRYPQAKYDSATTKSIELLPYHVKNQLFDLVIEKKSLDVISTFLQNKDSSQ